MLVFNQQANIKNVNGAIADIFANRPAPQSTFYLFYSTDTQEIYYDNGAWILLGTGGGGGTNIYNSDGTLTGNRTLSGANNNLEFADLLQFITSVGGNNVGFKLDFATNLFSFGDFDTNFNGTSFLIDDTNQIIKTQSGGNDIGLKLDFANNIFRLGYDNTSSINVYKEIPNNKTIIFTQNYYGDSEGIEFSSGSLNYLNLGFTSTSTLTNISIDADNSIIKTSYQTNDIGLKLDFANNIYVLGNNVSSSYIYISPTNIQFGEWNNGVNCLNADITTGGIDIGDISSVVNGTLFSIDPFNSFIKTRYQNNDIGLKLDFATSTYQFGQLTGGNATQFKIDDVNDRITTSGISNQPSGLDIYPNLRQFYFGVNASNNLTHLFINDSSQIATFASGGFVQGVDLNFSTHKYRFGRFNGGNTTAIVVDDPATYPLQIDGTNVTSGTAGGASGVHLKIKINGVDYKIELRNP